MARLEKTNKQTAERQSVGGSETGSGQVVLKRWELTNTKMCGKETGIDG